MKLESVKIKTFRSIEYAELTKCGGFNVLIGKNNSGKSNILSAIDAFFACIQGGNVVTIDPPIGKEIDFFDRKTESPIEITLTFSLTLAERDALIRDIVTEAPQMRNAVDGIDPSLRLSATVNIIHSPDSFGFVRELVLCSAAKSRVTQPATILSVSREAALELHGQLSRSSQRYKGAKSIRDAQPLLREWFRSRTEPEQEGETYTSPRYINIIRRSLLPFEITGEVSNELLQALESISSESTSAEDFLVAVKKLATRMEEEAKAIQEERLKNYVGTFAGDEPSMPTYVRNLLAAISNIKVLHLRERRKLIGKEEAERLLSLKVRRGGTEVLRNIQETVSALLGVYVDAFESGSPSRTRRGETNAEMDVDNFLVEVNGSGIREALRLVLDVEFEKPRILLVEEPEIHLHPALETSMMRYLKRISSNCQVFITTHSTNFLDTAEMKNVYLVSKPDSTSVQILDVEEAEAQIPKELGIRLSSLFMFDRLVFVEGGSDEDIIREWASKLGVNFSQSNVGFIPMGGVRNFAHYATEATLSFLTKRQVKMWFLMDRDEKEDSEVSKLQELLEQKAIVKILEKREIENYLICPRALVEFLHLKQEYSGNKINENLIMEYDVKEKIERCAEKLKQIAVDRRVVKILCKPVYPSKKWLFNENETRIMNRLVDEFDQMVEQLEEYKNQVETVYQEQSEYVNSVWQSSKLSIIPGDLLLDMVCQEYGVRFKKEKDGSRLAALMHESEIDQELKGIIQEIGN